MTERTVRYYVQQGLLPAPGGGRGPKYHQGYLDRLRLIRRLQSEHLPLAEIRRRLEGMSDAEVAGALAPAATAEGSARDYIDTVLGRSGGAMGRDGRGRPDATRAGGGTAHRRDDAAPGRGEYLSHDRMSTEPALEEAGPWDMFEMADMALDELPRDSLAAPASLRASSADTDSAGAAAADSYPAARSQWERLVLEEDIELHVRRPLSREMNRRLERLLEAARRILRDD